MLLLRSDQSVEFGKVKFEEWARRKNYNDSTSIDWIAWCVSYITSSFAIYFTIKHQINNYTHIHNILIIIELSLLQLFSILIIFIVFGRTKENIITTITEGLSSGITVGSVIAIDPSVGLFVRVATIIAGNIAWGLLDLQRIDARVIDVANAIATATLFAVSKSCDNLSEIIYIEILTITLGSIWIPGA